MELGFLNFWVSASLISGLIGQALLQDLWNFKSFKESGSKPFSFKGILV